MKLVAPSPPPPKEQNCNKDSSVSSQIHGEDFSRPMGQQQNNYQVLSNVLAAGRQDGHSAVTTHCPLTSLSDMKQ
jgi:hypothetical protein